MKQTQKGTTDCYPLANFALHSVEISSISGVIYSVLKVFFCYKIMLKEHSPGAPWEVSHERLR